MININVLQELHKYSSLYEERWGKEIDYTGLPANISQERLLLILRYIADTGESVLTGAKRIRDIIREYSEYIHQEHAAHGWNIENGYIFGKPCPLCGNKVRYIESGSSYSYACSTANCFNVVCRGI